jgi:transcriptional regulator NrdR family protein
MEKNEWEIFWEWISSESDYYGEIEEFGLGTWLNDKKREWESLKICPDCNVPGLKKKEERYDGHTVAKYDQCQNCMGRFNSVSLWDEAKWQIIEEIERGHKSPNDIRYLIERFDIHEDDVKKAWVREVIIDFKREVAEAKEFARVSQEEKDAWQKELKKRLQRVVDRDEEKKKRNDNRSESDST